MLESKQKRFGKVFKKLTKNRIRRDRDANTIGKRYCRDEEKLVNIPEGRK